MVNREHLDEVESQGYCLLDNVVSAELICEFERQISVMASDHLSKLGIQAAHSDPFVDLFLVGGEYTARFYKLLGRLHVLNRMCMAIADALDEAGFSEMAGIKVPLIWPDIRADIPGDSQRQLPVHQDYKSTQCGTALRMWVPLRDADERLGTMCVYPGTHRSGRLEHDMSDPLKPTVPEEYLQAADRLAIELRAGNGVLMDPLLCHASVANRSLRTKFTLLVQIQDLATMNDPRDPEHRGFSKLIAARERSERAMAAGT